MNKVLQLDLVQPVSFPADVQKHLRTMAAAGHPNEVCGLIYEHNIVVQYPNVHHQPNRAFDFDAPLDKGIKAMWHSHPGGLEAPSADDLPCMKKLLELGFTFPHLIVTLRKVLEYRPSLVDLDARPESLRRCS